MGNISMENVPVYSLAYPAYFLAGDYRIDLKFWNEKNLTILLYRIFGTIVPNGIDQLLLG